ncbi:MFS transporter [Streptomyces sp. SPB162]|uniref:MFS transporter n=1 Tax=Streptomyces sp. SPB162 TaxID=2940560 RepID=UPI002405C50F|nr:MFS transporter [Streptomyces sp. SPB162]MDF9811075.1 MFS family permease [Streptomyces sp. SPB162]
MSLPPTFPVTDPFVRRERRLGPGAAFYLQASIVVAFLAASSAPTPLYAVYQGEWGFSPITTTMVFGIYALAVLAALLTVGSLSDHVGRRPVLLAALVLQAVAMVVLTTAGGVPELMIARIVQGLSTGAAVGAVGAGMLDLDKAKGTIANAIAPMTGTATGALASGLLVQFLPAPTHLVYVALLAVFVLQGVGVALMRETSAPEPGALASLRPRFGVPKAARGPLLVAAPVLVAVWALAGLYGSVMPAVVRGVVGSDSLLLGGLALFALAGSGAVSVLLLRNAAPGRVMLLGTVALIVGVGVTLLAVDHNSAAAFFTGTVIAGVGFGGGFQGAIRTIVPLAAPHERSGLLSTIYVLSYLAMGLPAVIGGYLVVHGGGLLTTTREYGIAVMALGALALLGLAVPRRGTRAVQHSVVVGGSVPAPQRAAVQEVEYARR